MRNLSTQPANDTADPAEKYVLRIESLSSRAEFAVSNLERNLGEATALDCHLLVTEETQMFARAKASFEDGKRAAANHDSVAVEQKMLIAFFVAEETVAALVKVLRAEAVRRFPVVEKYFVDHAASKIDDLAKLKLESARYLLNTEGSSNVWQQVANQVHIIKLLIEAHAIAFCRVRNKRVRNPWVLRMNRDTEIHDTIRWSAA